jgi:hypothetical protein
VLGPRPPPWRKHEIYWFLMIFHDFGVFNRAGKTVSKIGIYALPPLKSGFYRIFIPMGYNLTFWNGSLLIVFPLATARDSRKTSFSLLSLCFVAVGDGLRIGFR